MILKDNPVKCGRSISRVMGYYRPTDAYNIGKLAEHKERRFYSEEKVIQAIEESELTKEAV